MPSSHETASHSSACHWEPCGCACDEGDLYASVLCVSSRFSVNVHTYMLTTRRSTVTHEFMLLFLLNVCVFMCMCVWGGEERRKGHERQHARRSWSTASWDQSVLLALHRLQAINSGHQACAVNASPAEQSHQHAVLVFQPAWRGFYVLPLNMQAVAGRFVVCC